jgi:hypothetical protein
VRPWTFPANIWRTTSGTSARPTTCIVRASLFTSRSHARISVRPPAARNAPWCRRRR